LGFSRCAFIWNLHRNDTEVLVIYKRLYCLRIYRKFPSAVVAKMNEKIENATKKWENKIENLEKSAASNWTLYVIWTLKCIPKSHARFKCHIFHLQKNRYQLQAGYDDKRIWPNWSIADI
jgi:hypothetical protein